MRIATLGVRIDNTEGIASARVMGSELVSMGDKGVASAARIAASSSNVAASIYAQADAMKAASSGFLTMEQASEAEAIALRAKPAVYQQVTDATRAMTLTQMEAIKINEELIPGHEQHALSLGRVAKSFEVFSAKALGANEQLSLLGASMGHLEFGEIGVVGALAGVFAGIEIWRAWTESTRTAAEEQNKLTDAFEKWAKAENTRGDHSEEIEAETKKIKDLHKALDDMATGSFFTKVFAEVKSVSSAGWIRILTSGPSHMLEQFTAEAKAASEALQKAIDTGTAAITTGKNRDAVDALKAATEVALKAYEVDHKNLEQGDREIEQGLREAQVLHDKLEVERAGLGTKNELAVALKYEAERMAATTVARNAEINAMEAQERVQARLADQAAIAAYGHKVIATGVSALGSNVPNLLISPGTAATIAAEQEAEKEQARFLSTMQKGFSRVFDDILTKGIGSFKDLFAAAEVQFEKFIAELASKKLIEKYGASMAGLFGMDTPDNPTSTTAKATTAGLSAAFVGFSAGYATGYALDAGRALGATAGAAAGALSGAAIGNAILPGIGTAVGAAAGGFAGLVGGLLGAGAAAAAEAEQQRQLKLAFDLNIAKIKGLVGETSPLSIALAQNAIDFDALRKQAVLIDLSQTTGGWKDFAEVAKNGGAQVAEVNRLEALRTQQLKDQAAEQELFDQQDLTARALAATGHQDEADALSLLTKQQREYAAAQTAGKNATDLATLAITQQMETTAAAITKVKGVIDGFTNTIAGLQSFKDSLALSDTIAPAARLAEAQRQYQAVVDAAKSGDQGAAGRLPTAAQTLLDAAKTMYASGPQFQEIFNKVNADTDAVIKFYQDQRTIAQQQLDALLVIQQTQIDALVLAKTGAAPAGIGARRRSTTATGAPSPGDDTTSNIQAVTLEGFRQNSEKLDTVEQRLEEIVSVLRNGFDGRSL